MPDFAKLRDQSVADIAPSLAALDEESWQKRKSAQTREALLRAATRVLAERGYSALTTQLVTEEAAISRGAMLHHFATKKELVAATIEYVFYRRIVMFYDRIMSLSERQRVSEIAGVEVFWETMKTVEFEAYLELMIAARTDDTLRDVLYPLDRKYNAMLDVRLPQMFPEWGERMEAQLLARDLITTAMQGLLINMHLIEPRARRARLRKFLSQITRALLEGELDAPDVSASEVRKID